ncbi:MAG: metalloregulator ArsR/SmtB family transcription factor [Desulfovibrionaceae bacterium]
MFDFLSITRALSDANRLRILMALRAAPLCVCQITAFLDLAPSTTSKHLSILRQARLIESTKQGRWVYYQLPAAPSSPLVDSALGWAQSALSEDPQIIKDSEYINALLHAAVASGLASDDPERLFCHSPELHLLDTIQRSDITKGKYHDPTVPHP